jgi:hypothetical protein
MKNRIIGNPAVFAIEYKLLESPSKIRLGGCRIWLSGCFIGDIHNDIYLSSTASSLIGILNTTPFTGELPKLPLSAEALLAVMTDEKTPEIGDYCCLAIDGYDHFLKLFFNCGSSMIIYSSLHPDLEDWPEYIDYPREPRCATIPIAYFKEIVSEFAQEVDLLNQEAYGQIH